MKQIKTGFVTSNPFKNFSPQDARDRVYDFHGSLIEMGNASNLPSEISLSRARAWVFGGWVNMDDETVALFAPAKASAFGSSVKSYVRKRKQNKSMHGNDGIRAYCHCGFFECKQSELSELKMGAEILADFEAFQDSMNFKASNGFRILVHHRELMMDPMFSLARSALEAICEIEDEEELEVFLSAIATEDTMFGNYPASQIA
jgi:hypothetical protein